MPSKRDKTTGLPIPDPVVPPTSICLKIQVPNALEYRTALKGALSELGKSWNWSQTVGEDNTAAYQAAELWRERLAEAIYTLDCELAPMSCPDVANCIETSTEVQNAIAVQIATNQAIKGATYDQARHGVPMGPIEANVSLTAEAGCVLDNLFGSVTAIVEQFNTNNIDFLEQFEIESNTIERARALFAAIPLFETLPVDDALEFIDTVMGEFKEFYDAAYTTALKDEYRCDLFCRAKGNPDCALSFEMIVSYFEERLGAQLSNEALFLGMVEFLVAGSWSGTEVVDAMNLAQAVIWREASNFLGVSFRTLQTVGLLGANDPDEDWELLCDDCNIICTGTWPDPMTFVQGIITGRVGDVYSVALEVDPVPGYKLIHTSEFNDWSKGSFLLEEIEIIGAEPFQIYMQNSAGVVIYDGKSATAANLVLPACVRYLQFVKRYDTGEFSTKLTIVT